jgi:Outer membrane protein/protective antigen OMA87
MRPYIINKYSFIFICLLQAACSGTKHLPKGEKLYTGAKIKFETTDKINRRNIKTITKTALRPEPNTSYLGIRPKLWLYMAVGEDPKSKFGKWLKNRGEAPVLISSVKPEVTTAIIDAKLFNIGIFKSYSESKIVEKTNTARVIYTSHIHKPYTVKDLIYAIPDDSLSSIILAEKKKSLIKPGEDYNLDILKNERIRIDALLKNNGYFYFNPDYLLFKVDTSGVDRTISLKLTLKDSIPKNALIVYHINNIYIDEDYSLNEGDTITAKDTIRYQNYVFLGKKSEMNIRPTVILRSVYLKKNEIYSRQNHYITLNRLMSMGNFKFVQVKFSDSDTTAAGFLDVTILMTIMPNRSFRAEIDIVSKSNNFTGPKMNLSILNRNTFKGAELLNLNMAGSFEAQFNGNNKNLYSYSMNPQIELTFPRFLVPFNIKRTSNTYIPKTSLLLSYSYMKRVDYFDMRTFQFIYGFKWRENIRKEHELNPINVSYSSITNQSAAFTELLASNPFLKKSYEELFIAGGSYAYTYNEQTESLKKIQFFLLATAETAGNVFSLAKLIGGEKPSSENPSKVIGSIYSQYAKLSIDARVYYNLNDRNKLAMRFFAGTGKPFGNSSVLPYTKQFFSGGPNSLRGFQINSVGPGTFFQNVDNRGFLQLGGEIKLETNAEYRFNIYRFIKGALFVDAGNVWLQKSNPENTGSPFLFSRFINEVAVGAGAGIRIDVSIFTLRFDLAMPLRKPWLEENHRWVTNQINFSNSSWRRENLVLNVAIGYPF